MIRIYYLEDELGKIFYVGKTKNSLPYRLGVHNYNLKKLNIKAKIFLLDEVEDEGWKRWEGYWIEQFRQWGFELLNKNDGGGGVIKHSQETINKIVNHNDYKSNGIKISKAKLGSKYNITIRGKDHPLYGIKQSEETIKKKIISLTGQIKSPYKIRKDKGIKKPNISGENSLLFGTKFSDNHKKNMRLSAMGNKNKSKIVYQLDLEGNEIRSFESSSEAERQLNIKGILNVCNGRSKSAGGFKWRNK
jgi:hypothetical protein